LLQGVAQFQSELYLLNIETSWFLFGVRVSLGLGASVLLVAALFVLLLRRLLFSVRAQRLLALDVKQAQEIQQVIVPQAMTSYPGLTIQSEYRPAREVGGDFFQIIPHSTDKSLLIVAGDVTGKGLSAGMLVALLVGAIRTAAQYDPGPLAVLNTLNLRLMGRGSAATCLALRIAADGAVTLANAGHLPPYLNAEPLAMEGALPLGIFAGAEFSVMHFQLKPGDKLLILSDGIVEATDPNGELFGFDRILEMLRNSATATDLIHAAQAFGQEDDISLIAVTRTAALDPALA
jgi:serine phosphatase RsbU (regulator of sigma subunit)